MIWKFNDYREYLKERVGLEGSRTGMRKKLSEALAVHSTFVSQVLKDKGNLSLEQAEGTNEFLSHTADEGEYFLLLVMRERAGTPALRKRFESKIQAMREQRLNIKSQLQTDQEISPGDREKFYSSALYGAVHVLSSIPKFRTADKIADALSISRERAHEIVEFLLNLGVLVEKKGEISPGSRHIHLGKESPLILRHHANWRMHTLQRLQFKHEEDLHYSACVSLSHQDALRVKESMLENLKKNIDVISSSPEETAYVYSFDFFPLK